MLISELSLIEAKAVPPLQMDRGLGGEATPNPKSELRYPKSKLVSRLQKLKLKRNI